MQGPKHCMISFLISMTHYVFKFIVYNNKESIACYDETVESDAFSDGELYTIYKVSYDIEKGEFGDVETLVKRNKLGSCQYYEEDMKLLMS